MSTPYVINNDGGSTIVAHYDNAVEKPMSIKDRIRAMNLIAEKTLCSSASGVTVPSRSKVSNQNSRIANGIACDLLTLDNEIKRDKQRKPLGLSSDPGVGIEKETATKAINKWRSRISADSTAKTMSAENKVEDDGAKIEWTIFDLTKGSRKNGSSLSPVPKRDDYSIITNNMTDKNASKIATSKMSGVNSLVSSTASKISGDNSLISSEIIRGGRKSPIISTSNSFHQIHSVGDFGFILPKLKPGRRAPKTLELVNRLTSPVRKVEFGTQPTESSNVFRGSVECSVSPKQTMTAKKLERNAESVDKEEEKGEERLNPVVVTSFTNDSHHNNVQSMNSPQVESFLEKKMHLKLNINDPGNVKKKIGTPQRSKISDRIKAFSSAANGSTWKHQSPAHKLSLPPVSASASSFKKLMNRDGQNLGEDSSCASSEKQSVDGDSISVCTPMATGTPARLGAQPPTPNSYNSEAAYTSVASSSDVAVAGSFASSEQNPSTQLQYDHVSTPSSSVQDDVSIASPKHTDIVVTKPGMKNSLQSKLEYDKQRAARRLRMSKKRIKVPSTLVAAQKKAQDLDPIPKWGAGHISNESTPERKYSSETMNFSPKVSSLDDDPTIQEQTLTFDQTGGRENLPEEKAERTSLSVERKVAIPVITPPSSKSTTEGQAVVKHGQMKADVMKQLINKRRRRKVNQNAKTEVVAGKDPSIKKTNESKSRITFASAKDISESNHVDKNTGNKNVVTDSTYIHSPSSPRKGRQRVLARHDRAHSISYGSDDFKELNYIENIDVQENMNSNVNQYKSTEEVGNCSQNANAGVKKAPQMPNVESDETTFSTTFTIPSTHNNVKTDSDENQCAPPLPPDIVRSNLEEKEQERHMHLKLVPSFDDGEIIQARQLTQTMDTEPNSPSNSVSVASSLFQDYPDDEDEPEPVVDSFINVELSPIRSQDMSKHDFDTSASYRGSPDSHANRSINAAEKLFLIPRYTRDSTPRRANRLITNRSMERYLNSSMFSANISNPRSTKSMHSLANLQGSDCHSSFDHEASNTNTSLTVNAHKFESNIPNHGTFLGCLNHDEDYNDDISVTCNDVRPSPTSSVASSAVSAIAARANKILLERRSKRTEPASPSHERHAKDLAHKIMKDSYNRNSHDLRIDKVNEESILNNSSFIQPTKDDEIGDIKDEVIINALFIDESREESFSNNQLSLKHLNNEEVGGIEDNIITLEDTSNQGELCSGHSLPRSMTDESGQHNFISKHVDIQEDSSKLADTSRDNCNVARSESLEVNKGQNCISEHKDEIHDERSTIIEKSRDDDVPSKLPPDLTRESSHASSYDFKSYNTTSSELDMDVNTIDSSLDYEDQTKASTHFTCLSMACCNQHFDNSDSLNFSTMSAVRISQESDDDVPFDEEAGAIEVEYIPNENLASVTKGDVVDGSILMHVSSTLLEQGGYFTSYPNFSSLGKDKQLLNYVSESSGDTSDDLAYPASIST